MAAQTAAPPARGKRPAPAHSWRILNDLVIDEQGLFSDGIEGHNAYTGITGHIGLFGAYGGRSASQK